jgi:serine O-acetyltransferase
MPDTLRDLVRGDLAWYGRPSPGRLLLTCLTSRTFRPVLTLRLVRATTGPAHLVARVAHRIACAKAGVDLPTGLTAGPGLKLTHGWGVVVTPGCVLGRDVILMHGATIGRRGAVDDCPTIGDRVFIGPNASVLGRVRIGDGATISAGCVVVQDVPADTMVMVDKSVLLHRPYVRPVEQ